MIQILIPSGFAVMSCDTFTASREKRETRLFLKSGCKDRAFFSYMQIFHKKSVFFVKNWRFMSCKSIKRWVQVVQIYQKLSKSDEIIWKYHFFFVTSARPYSQANKESSEITARQCRALSRVFHKENEALLPLFSVITPVLVRAQTGALPLKMQ